MIYYETGDFYRGGLKKGQRNGVGYYYEKQTKMTYNGNFQNDKRHGNGTLCSESKANNYVYDGNWYEGMRNGQGQEVTSKGKYNGEWFEDMRHGKGISIENTGDVYEGEFKFNKRYGYGVLTKCKQNNDEDENEESKGEVDQKQQIEVIKGQWVNDQLVQNDQAAVLIKETKTGGQ